MAGRSHPAAALPICSIPANARTRFDAIFHSQEADSGSGVAYQVQYALRMGARSPKLWVEDTGRWFAGQDGKPLRAHGLVRIINDRYEHEQQLAYLSRFDALTGEINRWHLTEQLEQTLQDAARAQTSCGFLLVAIDNLGRINEAYGYDVADEVIGVVAKRLRGRMRAEDCLGRFSGNKFGIILQQLHARGNRDRGRTLSELHPRRCRRHLGRSGLGDRHDRRRRRAASCRQCARGAVARAGNSRPRQGEASRLVSGLCAECRARGDPARQYPRHRPDRHRAERAAHPAGL